MDKKKISIFIILLFVTSAVFANGIGSKSFEENKLKLVRIYSNEYSLSRDFEIISVQEEYFEVILSYDQLNSIKNSEMIYEILIEDVIEYENSIRGQYHTLAQIETILDNIADNYPDITSLYSIGTTYEDREIWCLEIKLRRRDTSWI